MKYCKKCGSEIPEGVSFCETCGNPVGQAPKQGSGKKKWILAIGSGVIILAVAVVGALFATGVIGGKDNVEETGTDTADVQETPSVTEEAGAVGQDTQESQKSDVNVAEDRAYEAYVAYKDFIKQEYDEKIEEYYEESEEDEEDYDTLSFLKEEEECKSYALIYLDSDEYPELLILQTYARPIGGGIYTYKDNEVEEISDIGFGGSDISFQKKKGYIYSRGWYTVEWTEGLDFYDGNSGQLLFNNTIPDNGENNYYGVEKVAELAGIDNNGEWTTLAFTDSEDGSDLVWGENIDEAYTQLSRNMREENN